MELPSVQTFVPRIPDFKYGDDRTYQIKAVNQKPYPRDIYVRIVQKSGQADPVNDYTLSSSEIKIPANSTDTVAVTLTLKGKSVRETEEFLELSVGSSPLIIRFAGTPPCVWSQELGPFFTGNFKYITPHMGYQALPVTRFSFTGIQNVFMESNAWDWNVNIYYRFDPVTKEVESIGGMGEQIFIRNGISYAYTAKGTFAACDRPTIRMTYKIIRLDNGAVSDDDSITYFKEN